jgi:replication-associated recombination protein RarA
MIPFSELTSVGGYPIGEVASALQKCIRRGDEDGALFWATELDLSGFGEYAMKRLRIIASEDVGMGEPTIASDIRSLYDNWAELKKKGDKVHFPERLFLVHAVMLLARARKSRAVDNACVVFYMGKRERREVPDFALDKHTKRGRNLGRGFRHFFEEGAKIENENDQVADPYNASAVKTLVKNGKPEQGELV